MCVTDRWCGGWGKGTSHLPRRRAREREDGGGALSTQFPLDSVLPSHRRKRGRGADGAREGERRSLGPCVLSFLFFFSNFPIFQFFLRVPSMEPSGNEIIKEKKKKKKKRKNKGNFLKGRDNDTDTNKGQDKGTSAGILW